MALQSGDGATRPLRQGNPFHAFFGRQISSVDGVLKMVLALHERAACNVKEAHELAICTSSKAFGDIVRT
jgi:hypothetical protein